ncbi:hypothetical protein Nepgr_019514 [Nepenthes gracilis]|uniref:RING-type E3 ubiquitin transferase n=1 Tax=Nepenthes gracilis TaxID=150966 RepID=A0AAD3STL5_NEPGR|nr:hypothetical protein Nepgr_019514 [Nepenthes gracilis]
MGTPCFWALHALLMFSLFRSSVSYAVETVGFETHINGYPYKTPFPKYDRIDEVKKACAFVLDSTSQSELTEDRLFAIEKETSFSYGDWEQLEGKSPLIPLDGKFFSGSESPAKLASFRVTNVDDSHRSGKAVSVNAVLDMLIALDGPLVNFTNHNRRRSRFEMWQGQPQLKIDFQGIYFESEMKDAKRVMCLLGETALPSRSSSNKGRPTLLQDDKILLVLHYPQKLTLTSVAVRGELKSLNPKTDPRYFNEIRLLSQLTGANYNFGPEAILSKACNPYPYSDSLLNDAIDIYKGLDFCIMIERYFLNQPLNVVPNWRCKGTDGFCSKLGPFAWEKKIRATNAGFTDIKLLMQNVHCQSRVSEKGSSTTARVFAVFRAMPPDEPLYRAASRSGLSNMTLAAEGIWKSSSGQLCMVGCLVTIDDERNSCDSRICLYIPVTYSITQRRVFLGSISSINVDSPPYFPLSFELPIRLRWSYLYRFTQPHYQYSKIDSAAAILKKDDPSNLGAAVKKSLLKFPKPEKSEDYNISLSLLADDLTFNVPASSKSGPSSQPSRTNVEMQILSLDGLFGRHWWTVRDFSMAKEENPHGTKAEFMEKEFPLNVSAQLRLIRGNYSHFTVLALEGLYDPRIGKMYMIGCRDVTAKSMDLQAGLDCLIEVVVSYPPTTAQWLVNPTAEISISSKRKEHDPLNFKAIKLQTLPILYRQQTEDILSQRNIEGILQNLALSVAVACILSQLFYIRSAVDSVPYISLAMLSIHVLGYSLPLITDVEALIKRKRSESSYNLENHQLIPVVDYMTKLLVLVCVILTLRVFQKVWKSRIRLLAQTPLEPHHVPTDKPVLFATFAIHIVVYTSILVLHSVRMETYFDNMGNPHRKWGWEILLEEYIGLVHDVFLLPQVLGNIMWHVEGMPLRKLYYVGITIVRLLPHAYDYIRPSIEIPYLSYGYGFVNPNSDFYSKFSDIAIPLMSILLAVTVYIQQRRNYQKLRIAFSRVLPTRSRGAFELVSGAHADKEQRKELDDGE